MSVAAILKAKGASVISVKPDDSLRAVVEVLSSKRIGAVLALGSEGRVAGVLSERDVVRALASHGADALDRPVSDYMTAEVVHASPSDSVEALMEKMTHGRFRHLPILEGGRLVGIISIGDVVKRRIEDAVHEAAALREYVSTAG
ncbi:MAG: CBS domain-containing protein [Alphaproteobacteria bacterium]|nr:CBS domain-containing protein [Alphaproteobacteria bacterium]